VTDWDGLVKGLRAIGYSGTISLETANVLAAFPEEIHAEVLKLLHACSQYFAEKVSAEE
jgi:sugar phosphate isomerase/epimerase